MVPIDHFLEIQRNLRIHYAEWPGPAGPPVVLLHGWMDIARSWDPVAERLSKRHRVLALDFRGHGLSGWVGPGGYYHFPEYVLDVQAIVETAAGGGPVYLIGHSMGGMVGSLFAGTFPEKILRFANLEGFGPPDMQHGVAPKRFADWTAAVLTQGEKPAKTYKTLEEAAARMRKSNPRLSEEFSKHLAFHGTEKGLDGLLRFRFDPWLKTTSPQPFYLLQAQAFWKRITCPTLGVVGEVSAFKQMIPDWRSRMESYPDMRIVEIPGTGHMMHHEKPGELSEILLEFLEKR